ncbi:hypothetical protein [Burkholderia cepacia]|uniref:hypothetical protein n=1 Tax=Burkholderia cepacia TaxID=292 RepID=UPI000A708864|nr:hypothetical protein [Burkholderia cepacia]
MKSDHVSLIALKLVASSRAAQRPPVTRNGLPILSTARSATPITLDLVNQLRDDTPL